MSKSRKSKKSTTRSLTPGKLLLALIVLLAVIAVKTNMFAFARGPKASPTPTSSVKISVVKPNGGEKFYQGQANTISWKGGYRIVAIGLATADTDTNHAIGFTNDYAGNLGSNDGGALSSYSGPGSGYTGHVIGFINRYENEGYFYPNSSTTWDGLKVCNWHPNMDPDVWCKNVTPGNYKIFVWSEGEGGQSMCIGSGEGPTGKYTTSQSKDTYGCNWDLSDQSFTISAP